MKRVLHIITKLELGGAQKSTLDILRCLDRKKYKIFLLSSDGLLSDEARKIDSLEVELLPSLRREINLFFDLKAFVDLYSFIKKNDIDIVHTHSSKAGIVGRWAAYLAGVGIIIHTIHGWEFYDGQNRLIKWLYITLERLTARITTRLIAVCEAAIKKGLNYKIGTSNKYRLIYYGIDYNAFSNIRQDREYTKRCLGLREDNFIVGMIACFKPQKAHRDLIKAASLIVREVPGVQFLLVGDGALRSKMIRQIERLGLGDRFVLAGWRKDIPQILSNLDLVVLSSLWEGLPIVILEAMAAARAVVATNVGGVSEIVKEAKTGFLVEVGNYKQIANRITFLINNRHLATQMGRSAQQSLNGTFSIDSMIRNIEETYKELLIPRQKSTVFNPKGECCAASGGSLENKQHNYREYSVKENKGAQD